MEEESNRDTERGEEIKKGFGGRIIKSRFPLTNFLLSFPFVRSGSINGIPRLGRKSMERSWNGQSTFNLSAFLITNHRKRSIIIRIEILVLTGFSFPSFPLFHLGSWSFSFFLFPRVILSWSRPKRIKLIRWQSIVLRKQGNERRMGEEMGETRGSRGGEERRAATKNSFHFPMERSLPLFLFTPANPGSFEINPRPCPPSLTPKVLICSKATISTLAGYKYIYIYIRTSV